MIDFAGSYCGLAPVAGTLTGRWNLDPLVLAALALLVAGAWRLAPARRRAAGLAVGALAVAFVSPLCAASVALFSARAVHHLLLIGVAAPLLAAAWPSPRTLPPLPMLALATATLWAWHLPAAYDAALADVALYWAMQLSLLATAWAYWSAVARAPGPVALVAIVGGAAQMGMLGAVLTFAPTPLYASHLATTASFGIGPLADQQLAGLIMWVVGLAPYAIAAGWRLRGDWRRMAAA